MHLQKKFKKKRDAAKMASKNILIQVHFHQLIESNNFFKVDNVVIINKQ